MKKMRLPILIALGIAIIGIIFGSFFDFSISSAIASPTNGFGLTISAIGPTVGFAAVAAMGGGFIALIIKGKYHIALKIMFGLFAAACIGVAIYYPAGEWFGINGFYGSAPEWVGYLVVILPEAAAVVGGYFLFKDCKNKNMWIIFLVMTAVLVLTLLVVVPILKSVMHRPRYRLLINTNEISFHNWYEPFKEYNNVKDYYPHDNFKSYPSGHTAETSILLVFVTFLPLADKKFEKYQLPLFIGAGCLVVLVALARILAAAHFLSDVSFGATIMITLLFIANEVVMLIKPLQLPEENAQEEKAQ